MEDPLAEAKRRGIQAQRRLLKEEGGVVSGKEIGEMLGGLSAGEVAELREAGKLLALPTSERLGEEEGYRYPLWQVEERGRVLAGLEEVLGAFGVEDAWVRAGWMLAPESRLGDRRPLEVLRGGEVDAVAQAASAYGEHVAE